VAVLRSTLAEWVGICGVRLHPLVYTLPDMLLTESVLHADETSVPILAQGTKKTLRAYLCAYATTPYTDQKAVIYGFTDGHGGQYARDFLGDWRCNLICDDYSGYKQSLAKGVTDVGWLTPGGSTSTCTWPARARSPNRPSTSPSNSTRWNGRPSHWLPINATIYARPKPSPSLTHCTAGCWLTARRWRTVRRRRKRWTALTRYLDDGRLPIDNNWVENLIRPRAWGRSNWMFAGWLPSGQGAANFMSLIQSAKLNGREPYAYLKGVLEWLPTQKASQIHDLLHQHWQQNA
jgi:transposase